MHSIGPYTFTETDARRTVGNLDAIWALYAEGRDATILEPLYPTLTGDLATDLERVWTAWNAAGPALRADGQLPARAEGRVTHLSVSPGGLPKTPVDRVEVTWLGATGDRQATRVHHGRPWQALCLWSNEVIDAFRAAGHPIAPGLAGENITLSGPGVGRCARRSPAASRWRAVRDQRLHAPLLPEQSLVQRRRF